MACALSLEKEIGDFIFQKILETDSFAKSVFDDPTKSWHGKDHVLADDVVKRAKTIGSIESKMMISNVEKLERLGDVKRQNDHEKYASNGRIHHRHCRNRSKPEYRSNN